MNAEGIRWIEAGKILANNPEAKVLCPKNADGFLTVTDASSPVNTLVIERHIRCPVCGAYNAIRINRPKQL
jgi:hypothetical protein